MAAAQEKALIVFDYIGHAMRGKYVLEKTGLSMREVAPPPEYRTGCDLALEIDGDKVDIAEDILDKNDIMFMDILFMPKDAKLTPVYLTKLIKTTEYSGYTMVRCGNLKITYRKGLGTIVNVSGGG
jgi:hypothetical protein